MMVSLFALSLTWVSRQRAKVHNLRLPDVNGIEMPFFVTMGSLALIYLFGHFGPLGSLYNQLDLMVLTFGLLGLSLISLYGREDLPWRIPSAIEGIVMMLLLPRLVGALLFNATPFPFTIDLLDDSHGFIDWQMPWLFHEITLIGLALVWEWIEAFRRTNGMPDHRGAAGRGSFALMVVMISAGPAGLLAGILCMRRSFNWNQPAGVALSVYAILGGLFAFLAWSEGDDYRNALQWTIFATGCAMLFAQVYTVFAKMPKWTTAWLWNAHIILPVGVFAIAGWSPWLVVSILALSLATWVGGILQLRRGMRVMGALDLVLALCLALLILQGQILEPNMLLLMLVALGIELGIVAWLGTRHDMELARD